jgi:hypothetical protein
VTELQLSALSKFQITEPAKENSIQNCDFLKKFTLSVGGGRCDYPTIPL